MQEQITILVKLQEIDAEIYLLKAQKAEKPQLKLAFDRELETAKTTLKQLEEELKQVRLKQKELEIDLGDKEKNIQTHQSKTYQVKTNQELHALQKEIQTLEADKSVLEEDILGLLDKIDGLSGEIQAEKDALAAKENEVKEKKAEIDREVVEIDKKLQELDKRREEITPPVKKSILAQYERILENKNGVAVVPILNDACGGCHRVLPPQVINEAKIKNHLVICEFCARILYSQ